MSTTSSRTSSEPSERWTRSNKALGAWLAIAAALIAIAFGSQAAIDEDGNEERDLLFEYEFGISSVVVYAVIVGLTWLAARSFRDPRGALGLRSFPLRWLWITLALTFLALVVSAALEPILRAGEEQGLAPERWDRERAPAFVVNALVVTLVVPFAEELFFRGLGVRVLGFLGAAAAVLGTAAVFALAHGLLSALIPLGFFAVVLGWVRYRTASVWPGFIAHAAYNGVGILVAVYVALNPEDAPSAFLGLF